jgi:hypothetical protein
MSALADRLGKRLRGAVGEAAGALDAATAGSRTVSVGTVYVNGFNKDDAFEYRLTGERLVWNRCADPEVAGFALGDVHAFGSWENDRCHVVIGVDVGDNLFDLLLRSADDPAAKQQHLIARFLIHALRSAGANELTTAQPPVGSS